MRANRGVCVILVCLLLSRDLGFQLCNNVLYARMYVLISIGACVFRGLRLSQLLGFQPLCACIFMFMCVSGLFLSSWLGFPLIMQVWPMYESMHA
jgi:hypothetical protein